MGKCPLTGLNYKRVPISAVQKDLGWRCAMDVEPASLGLWRMTQDMPLVSTWYILATNYAYKTTWINIFFWVTFWFCFHQNISCSERFTGNTTQSLTYIHAWDSAAWMASSEQLEALMHGHAKVRKGRCDAGPSMTILQAFIVQS